jgi:hypothetical protein
MLVPTTVNMFKGTTPCFDCSVTVLLPVSVAIVQPSGKGVCFMMLDGGKMEAPCRTQVLEQCNAVYPWCKRQQPTTPTVNVLSSGCKLGSFQRPKPGLCPITAQSEQAAVSVCSS